MMIFKLARLPPYLLCWYMTGFFQTDREIEESLKNTVRTIYNIEGETIYTRQMNLWAPLKIDYYP